MSSSTSTKPLSARCDRESGRDRSGPPRRSGRLLRQRASEAEPAQALERILAGRDTDTEAQLRRLRETGFADVDCFYPRWHFGVIAGWRPADGGRTRPTERRVSAVP